MTLDPPPHWRVTGPEAECATVCAVSEAQAVLTVAERSGLQGVYQVAGKRFYVTKAQGGWMARRVP